MNAHDNDLAKIAKWINDKEDIEDELKRLDDLLRNKKIDPGEHKVLQADALKRYEPFKQGTFYSQILFDAAKNGNKIELLNKLIELKVDLNITDQYGNTPLKLAAEAGHEKIVAILLENGADPNIQSKKGNTALHGVSSAPTGDDLHKAKRIAEKLIEFGANPTLKNNDKETPADIAKSVRNQSLAQYLLEKIRAFLSGNKKDAILHTQWQFHKGSMAHNIKHPGIREHDKQKGVQLHRKGTRGS